MRSYPRRYLTRVFAAQGEPRATRANRVRVICHCGKLAGVIDWEDFYAEFGTSRPPRPGSSLGRPAPALAPRLRCRNGHEPRPGRERLLALYGATTDQTIQL
jgi:hypothetical protein